MSKKATQSKKKPTTKTRRAKKAAKVIRARFVCLVCNSNKKGGYFSAPKEKDVACPHCSSTDVRLLG